MEINIDHRKEFHENSNGKGNRQSRMKCIKCPKCGAEILMLPTLGKMVEAIENHVGSHRRESTTDMVMDRLITPSVRTNLTEQVLLQASDITDFSNKPPIWL